MSYHFDHPGPPWYYLVVVPVGCVPWTFFLVLTLWRLGRRLVSRQSLPSGTGFAALWAVVPRAKHVGLTGSLCDSLHCVDEVSTCHRGGQSATFLLVQGDRFVN